MKKVKFSIVLLVFIGLFLSSCSHRILDFTVVSSKNIDLSHAASFERGGVRQSGVDKVHIIIFVPTGTINLKEALDVAIEKTPGCVALVDGVIRSKYWWIPFIYGQSSYTIEGTPLIDTKLLANNTNKELPTYSIITLDKKLEIKSVERVSEEKYITTKNKMDKNLTKTQFKNSIEIN